MPEPSSTSVKVIYYNRQAVTQALSAALVSLVRSHPEIEEVVLFGSFVRGDTVPGSDVDMLLILSESLQPFLARIPAYLPTTVPGGVDVFPYTRQELTRVLEEGNSFVRRALAEGRRLSRQTVLRGRLGIGPQGGSE